MIRSAALFTLTTTVLFAQAPTSAELKPGKLEATVVNSVTGAPIGGIDVSLGKVGGTPYVTRSTSNEFGELRFDRMEPGSYRVMEVTAKGYTYNRPPEIAPIIVKEGETVKGFKVILIPPGAISGRVLDDKGNPIAGATVTAFQFWFLQGRRVLQPGGEAKTDAQGRYRIPDLAPQPFVVRVSVERATFWHTATYYPNADTASRAVRIAVPDGTEIPAIDFRVAPRETYHLRGTISNLGGEPYTALGVYSCPDDPWEHGTYVGSAQIQRGMFDIDKLPSGRYCLSKLGQLGPAAYEVVEIRGQDVNDLKITGHPLATLNGRVKYEGGASGKLMANMFEIQLIVGPPSTKIDTAANTFRIEKVLPGYTYKLTPHVSAGYVKSIKLNGEEIRGTDFRVIGDGELEIVVAPAKGIIKGRVSFPTGKERKVGVSLVSLAERSPLTDLPVAYSTDERGEFEFREVPPGDYKVLAWEKAPTDYRAQDDILHMPDFLALFSGTRVTVSDGPAAAIEVRPISAREFDEAKAQF